MIKYIEEAFFKFARWIHYKFIMPKEIKFLLAEMDSIASEHELLMDKWVQECKGLNKWK